MKDIPFYKNAFGATENLCFRNEDGSIHVAELCIDDAIFHVHEITSIKFFSQVATFLKLPYHKTLVWKFHKLLKLS